MPGVYALWELSADAMVYVGETASLRHRMRDIRRSVNHTCRRKLAAKHAILGVTEAQLSPAIGSLYVLSFLPVALGRLELEEYLSIRYATSLLNSPGRRLLHGNAYDWVPRAER